MKMPSSLGHISENLKHIVRYIGADADLWHGMVYLGVFNVNTVRPLAKAKN